MQSVEYGTASQNLHYFPYLASHDQISDRDIDQLNRQPLIVQLSSRNKIDTAIFAHSAPK